MTFHLSFLPFLFELLSAAIVFSLPLEGRKGRWLRAAGYTVLLSGTLIVTGILLRTVPEAEAAANSSPLAMLSSMLGCLLILAFVVGFVWFTCAVSAREALYCGVCAYLIEHAAYCIRLILEGFFNLPAEAPSPWYFLVHLAVCATAYFLFARRMVKNRHYASRTLSSLRLSLSVLAVVLVMSVTASYFGFEHWHGIYALAFCVTVLYSQIDRQRELGLESELRFQRELAAQQRAQYMMSRENIDLINRKCHDLKYQIAALKKLRDEGSYDSAITSLEDSVMIYDAIAKTGDDILDTVLTEKSLVCREHGIVLSVVADGSALDFLDPVDEYTLFGNALDNAVEAVEKLPENERRIDLQIRPAAGMTLLKLSNPYSGTVITDGETLKTSKADSDYHGFGVRNIRSIAEKYGGIVKIDTADGVFALQISFPPQ